jgi:hypothetical protein
MLVVIMWSISYWLGWSPQTFYKLYTVQVVVLGLVRFAVYRLRKWHYYLLGEPLVTSYQRVTEATRPGSNC